MNKPLFPKFPDIDETIASTRTQEEKESFCKIVDELKRNSKKATAKPRTTRKSKTRAA